MWVPEPVWALWRSEKSLAPLGNRTTISRISAFEDNINKLIYIYIYIYKPVIALGLQDTFRSAIDLSDRLVLKLLFITMLISKGVLNL